jgi:hypothetical protein
LENEKGDGLVVRHGITPAFEPNLSRRLCNPLHQIWMMIRIPNNAGEKKAKENEKGVVRQGAPGRRPLQRLKNVVMSCKHEP